MRKAKPSKAQRSAGKLAGRIATKLEPMLSTLQDAKFGEGGGDYGGALLHDAWSKLLSAKQSLERAARRLERFTSFEHEDEENRMAALRESAASGDPAAQSLLERRTAR